MSMIINRAAGIAVFCLACSYQTVCLAQTKEAVQPTGTTGVTAFQPKGAARGEAEASTGAQNGSSAAQPAASKPGFDNKPPKGARAGCHRPQGGVDASGGENIQSSSKDNTSCTGRTRKSAVRK
jgi:hypothetical protein